MKKLARKNPAKLLDLLVERFAFERTGVDLYTALLERAASEGDEILAKAVPTLARIRREEAEHQTWLEEQIHELGGSPGKPTHLSELSSVESRGIADVILHDRRSPEDMVHALMAAELVDHAGWNLLIQLAAEAEDEEAQMHIRKRLLEENEHLSFVRLLVTAYARRDMTGAVTDVSRKAA